MSREAEALRPLISDLVVRLQPDDIVDKLYETKLLTQADYEGLIRDVTQKSDLRGVNRRILVAVSKGPEGSVLKFAEIVKTSQPDLGTEILKAYLETTTVRVPSRHHSISTSIETMPTKADVTLQRLHDDDDSDVTQSCPPLSPQNQPFSGTDDAATASTIQPDPPIDVLVGKLQRQLKEANSRIEELSSCMERLYLQTDALSSKLEPALFQAAPLLHDDLILLPEKLPDLPTDTACATAVFIDKKVYVCGGRCINPEASRQVHVYCLNEKTWSTLSEPAPQFRCEAIAINNHLVLIGGFVAVNTITNKVSTWTGQCWQQDIPAMPTKRIRPGVIMYDKYVIAAGGMSDNNRALLTSIDILDTSMLQWWTPANFQLPRPMYALDITTSTSHMYVAAAIVDVDATNERKTGISTAWQLPVSVLEEVLTTKDDSSPHHIQWREIAPIPHIHSTVLKGCTHLLVVGGAVKGDHSGCNSTRTISVYDPIHNKWSPVGQLLNPRARCTLVAVNRSKILVCGGYSDTEKRPRRCIRSVELLSID